MKKIICLLVVLSMVVATFAGCGKDGQQQSPEPAETVISNSEQQDEITPTVSPSASASPTPSASPSASPSSTASKSISGTDGRNGRDGQDGKDGANGEDGRDGADGQTPYIGSNGNWWIGSTDTGVSATGQGTESSIGTPIANIPVGTKFPCYPNKEFDWVTDDGVTVHINSIDIELTDKEQFTDISWDEWATNPELRRERDQYQRTDYKYTISCKITGYTDPSLAGNQIWLRCFGIEDGIGAKAVIDDNGHFIAFNDGSQRPYYQQYIDMNKIIFDYASTYGQPTPSPTPTPEPPVIADVEAFIDVAKAQLDKPYAYGGKGPDSFDTSGFIYYTLKQSGSSVGFMTSSGWANSSYPNAEGGYLRGDILCMPGRLAIYLGNNQMIEASQSEGKVVIVELDDATRQTITCGKRLYNLTLPPSNGNTQAEAFVQKAFEQLDVLYMLGGKTPEKGFDCSGLVDYALNNSGNGSFAYMTSSQWAQSSYQTVDKFEDLQYGDIVCLTGHVAICIGDGIVIDASSAAGKVVMREMSSWFEDRFICGKRLFGTSTATMQSETEESIPTPSPTQTPKESPSASPTEGANVTPSNSRELTVSPSESVTVAP
ncbi:C40 family peptidase [Christensenella tenuis]|uniref:C40 family peptidase n=1 Tax=Christensenella tenuis TaxID=2763033 RepID=A0ABR7EDJ2_9FIRM|nr:NlpC/P60 family protein [Christensenella tenuis]MBC5647846.1 C40 family peptidase [Christensenella tenuis]